MKKLLLAGTACLATLGLAATAQAGDAASPAYDWSGFTVGVNAGAGFPIDDLSTSLTQTGSPAWLNTKTTSNSSSNSFTGGASLGYNWQANSIVWGLEGDINYLGSKASQTAHYTNYLGVANDTADQTISFNSDWFSTVRGRLGYAMDNVLIYGTAGAAFSGSTLKESMTATKGGNSSGIFSRSQDYVSVGLTLGAGVEVGFDNWSIGAEYLIVPQMKQDLSYGLNGGNAKGTVNYGASIARATLKMRF